MNDRFKFRVWDIEDCTYFEPRDFDDLWLNENAELRVGFYSDATQMIEDYTDNVIIEQCTGLKDKNGNLIYENDQVGFYVYGQDEEWHAQQGTVIWYNSCWGIETSSRFIQFENELTIKNPKDIEIIGNVHEQAEQKDK